MKKFIVKVNGTSYEVEIEEVGSGFVSQPVQNVVTEAPKSVAEAPVKKEAVVSDGTAIKAPLPGNILDIRVSEGKAVKSGDILMILEAMKMENEILAPQDGVISSVNVTKGAAVGTGDLLAVIK